MLMIEYRGLGHMKKVETNDTRYCIPHLPVFCPDSTTTKIRVVFNAFARNKSGSSLNEMLMNKPIIQPELFDTLLRFLLYKIAFTADISKMYRQIEIHPEDWHFQSILWRNESKLIS